MPRNAQLMVELDVEHEGGVKREVLTFPKWEESFRPVFDLGDYPVSLSLSSCLLRV